MRDHYDFSKMKGRKNPFTKYLKQPVTMRLDRDTVTYFKAMSEKTGIPLSKYGSLEFIESLVKKISLREGFGDILAQGVIKAADYVGGGARELIGELVLPRTGEEWVYDPRMFITTGIFYAMEPKRPIQHLHLRLQGNARAYGDERDRRPVYRQGHRELERGNRGE